MGKNCLIDCLVWVRCIRSSHWVRDIWLYIHVCVCVCIMQCVKKSTSSELKILWIICNLNYFCRIVFYFLLLLSSSTPQLHFFCSFYILYIDKFSSKRTNRVLFTFLNWESQFEINNSNSKSTAQIPFVLKDICKWKLTSKCKQNMQ